MIAAQVQHFLDRARDFLKGMDLLKEEPDEFKYSSALLRIHCAISYSDALRTGMGCTDVSSGDHRSAAVDLKTRLVSRNFETMAGVNRLDRLLSRKNRIAYVAVAAREDEVEDIVKQANRFADWAETTGRKLQIKGW